MNGFSFKLHFPQIKYGFVFDNVAEQIKQRFALKIVKFPESSVQYEKCKVQTSQISGHFSGWLIWPGICDFAKMLQHNM